MKHSIMIPDSVWEYWQRSTGLKNPARAIRDEITRVTTTYAFGEAIMAEEAAQAALPDSINDDEVDFDTPDEDVPTLITVERIGACKYCFKVIRGGEQAFWFTYNKRKYLAHVECWDEDHRES